MAKTAKIKKRQITPHSRAARRASSPTPKNLLPTNTRTPSQPPKVRPTPHILAAKSSGIQKRQKTKPMKRGQRARLEKNMSKAEDVLEKLEVKVKKSVGREQRVRERAKGWEEVNEVRKRRRGEKGNAFALLEEEDEKGTKEREWVSDEEMDGVAGEDEEERVAHGILGEVKEVVVPASVPLPVASAVEDDELL